MTSKTLWLKWGSKTGQVIAIPKNSKQDNYLIRDGRLTEKGEPREILCRPGEVDQLMHGLMTMRMKLVNEKHGVVKKLNGPVPKKKSVNGTGKKSVSEEPTASEKLKQGVKKLQSKHGDTSHA